MKFRLPFKKDGSFTTIGVGVEGKTFTPDKDRVVDIPDRTPEKTLHHLLTLGWEVAEEKTAKNLQEIGIKVAPQSGQIVADATLEKAVKPAKK